MLRPLGSSREAAMEPAGSGGVVFGFRHALRPPVPPVGPDPRLWGHIVLLVLTPVIPSCRL